MRRLRSAHAHPFAVVSGFVFLQLLVTTTLAWRAQHNGWVYFQGGDQIWYASSAGLLANLELPPTLVGGGWPLVLAPITWITGPTFLQALPAIVLLGVLVLAPLALVAVYGLASQIGGRYFGYWCAGLWVVAPVAAIPLFVDRYHERYVDQFLPQALGLTAMADFPSMVLLLGAAYFVLRSASVGGTTAPLAAGALAGYAGWVKPPNLLFLLGAVAALAVARRSRELLVFGAAVLPGVLTLALWKYRGLGELPVLAFEEARVAFGTVAVSGGSLDRYVRLDWGHWGAQMAQLREYFWSARLAQWAPFAGALAVLRIAPVAGVLTTLWLGAFLVIKGTSPLASIELGSFFRLLMPAWPAYFLLFAAIPLLTPGVARKLANVHSAGPQRLPDSRKAIAAIIVAAGLPLLVVSVARPIAGSERVVVQKLETTELLTPVLPSLAVALERRGDFRVIRWRRGEWRSDVFFRVYRTDRAGSDVECRRAGAVRCLLATRVIGTTRGTVFFDAEARRGATYRVGVATNWRDDTALGDVFAVGPPTVGVE